LTPETHTLLVKVAVIKFYNLKFYLLA
jgi:hypothetical protein